MKVYFLAWAFFALIPAGPVNAESALDSTHYSKAFTLCMDKSGGVTSEMMGCIDAELARQDTRLNTEYTSLQARLSDERKTQLRTAQRSWITFRDNNCGFYYDPEGGSLARIEASMCRLQMTAERASELAMFNERN